MSQPSHNGHRDGPPLDLEPLGGAAAGGTAAPKMLVPLFLVPLLIVGLIVAIFLGVGSLVGTEKSVADWIREVETGGVNERWQAAATLTEIAVHRPEELAAPETRTRLRELFTVAGPEDTRIRQWIAKIWAAIGDEAAAPLVVDAIGRMREVLASPDAATSPNTAPARLELIDYVRAYARVAPRGDVAVVLAVADDADVGVRMAVAEALGILGRKAISEGGEVAPASLDRLRHYHASDDAWLRMNAALSLAKCGSSEGLPTLEAMVDRAWLKAQRLSFPDDGAYSVSTFDPAVAPIVSALVAIEALHQRPGVAGFDPSLVRVAIAKAVQDPNPAVQQRAKELFAKLGG